MKTAMQCLAKGWSAIAAGLQTGQDNRRRFQEALTPEQDRMHQQWLSDQIQARALLPLSSYLNSSVK